MTKNYWKGLLFGIACLTGMVAETGCKNGNVYEKAYTINGNGWRYRDTLNFGFDIRDTGEIYDIVLSIRHRTTYPLQNLYMNIYTAFPGGQRIKQLLNIDLADQTGKWNGKVSGGTCNFETAIQENAFFNAAGKHLITLEPFMRMDSLPGIEQVGLRVVDTGKRK